MFSNISWGQFLVFLVPLLVGYGVVVLYLFYRDSVSKSATSSSLVGKPSDLAVTSRTTSDGGVMGKTFEQKAGQRLAAVPAATTTAVAAPTTITCEACGHVHGTLVAPPRLNSYGMPINRTAEPATFIPLTDDFDPVDGGVDVQSMIATLEKVKTVTAVASGGAPASRVISEKAEVLSLFANDDLLNSEFASQLALQLDDSAPTAGYSAALALENLKAA